MTEDNKYLKQLRAETPKGIYRLLTGWKRHVTEDEIYARSVILNVHSLIEFELGRVFYHHFRLLIDEPDDRVGNKKATEELEKMVRKLGFLQMYRMLKPIFECWPFDFDHRVIGRLNELRNQIAHPAGKKKIEYNGRNPLEDTDCLAELYLDAWAINRELRRFIIEVIEGRRGAYEYVVREEGENKHQIAMQFRGL